MKVMLAAFFARPKLHSAPGADQRGRDRGEVDGQADRRRHGKCSDGGDGTGQPNGFGRCRKMEVAMDFEGTIRETLHWPSLNGPADGPFALSYRHLPYVERVT